MKLVVQGMTCGHCVKAVTAAIAAFDPDARVQVDLAAGRVDIDGPPNVPPANPALASAGPPAAPGAGSGAPAATPWPWPRRCP